MTRMRSDRFVQHQLLSCNACDRMQNCRSSERANTHFRSVRFWSDLPRSLPRLGLAGVGARNGHRILCYVTGADLTLVGRQAVGSLTAQRKNGKLASASPRHEPTEANANWKPQKRSCLRPSQRQSERARPVPGLQGLEQLLIGQGSPDRSHPGVDRGSEPLVAAGNPAIFSVSL